MRSSFPNNRYNSLECSEAIPARGPGNPHRASNTASPVDALAVMQGSTDGGLKPLDVVFGLVILADFAARLLTSRQRWRDLV